MEHYKNLSLNDIEEVVNGEIIKEKWIEVHNNKCYMVSNFGRLKRIGYSYKNLKSRILKQSFDKDGYLIMPMYKDKKVNSYRAAPTILLSFKIPNPERKPQVNHKKGIKTDNRLWELEWMTIKENQQHAITTGLKSFKNGEDCIGVSKLSNATVLYIFNSQKSYAELSKELKIKQYVISYIKRGVAWCDVTGKVFKKTRVNLSEQEIGEIVNSKESYSKLAKKYGVSKSYIFQRKKGKPTWEKSYQLRKIKKIAKTSAII